MGSKRALLLGFVFFVVLFALMVSYPPSNPPPGGAPPSMGGEDNSNVRAPPSTSSSVQGVTDQHVSSSLSASPRKYGGGGGGVTVRLQASSQHTKQPDDPEDANTHQAAAVVAQVGGEGWLEGSSPIYRPRPGDVPAGETVQYPAALVPPPRRVPGDCPNRYIFVNTHTFGRHHNQLQEMLNIALWAEGYLGRTAVLGWFRHSKQWTNPSEFYDMRGIMDRYCLVTPEEFGQRVQKEDGGGGPVSAECFGQGVKDTPLSKASKVSVKCRMASEPKAHYNVRNGMNLTKAFLTKVRASTAKMVVLSGQLGFFLRPGLQASARMYGLLKPNPEIATEVDAFLKNSPLWDTAAGKPLPYFGLHLRQREKECMKEVGDSATDGALLLKDVTPAQWKIIETQCAMTVPYVQSLQHSLGFTPKANSLDGAMFLASDHENMVLERSLVGAGATLYTGGKFHTREMGGLKGLAVDFFLLTKGKYFTGNQLSSISQNVCLVRLGQGLGCHGMVKPFQIYHNRNVTQAGLSYLAELAP